MVFAIAITARFVKQDPFFEVRIKNIIKSLTFYINTNITDSVQVSGKDAACALRKKVQKGGGARSPVDLRRSASPARCRRGHTHTHTLHAHIRSIKTPGHRAWGNMRAPNYGIS